MFSPNYLIHRDTISHWMIQWSNLDHYLIYSHHTLTRMYINILIIIIGMISFDKTISVLEIFIFAISWWPGNQKELTFLYYLAVMHITMHMVSINENEWRNELLYSLTQFQFSPEQLWKPKWKLRRSQVMYGAPQKRK